MSTISIVIPTYNEKGNIEPLVTSIDHVFQQLPKYTYEIIIVDDNSPDGTAMLAKQIALRNTHVRVKVRYTQPGLGVSIAEGLEMARGDIVVGMDADMNHDPAVIPQMIRSLSEADLVVASRFVKGGGMADPIRLLMSGIFNCVLRGVFGFPIWDNTSGYYALKRKTLRKLDMRVIYFGYGEYHLRLVYEIMRKGMRIVEVPVFYKQRLFGESKSRLFTMMQVYMSVAIRLRMGREG